MFDLPLMQWASNNFPLIGTFEIAVVDVKAALNKCSEKRFDVRFVLDGFLFNLIFKSNFYINFIKNYFILI